MQTTAQTSSLNSKVGRTYTWDPINGKEERPSSNPILDMADPEPIPIPTERHTKPWRPFLINP